MLRTFSPPEHGPQLVSPVLPSWFCESSASRIQTRSAGSGLTRTEPFTVLARPRRPNDPTTGMVMAATFCPAGEVSVHVPDTVWPSRSDAAIPGAPLIVHPAGTVGASTTWSSWSSMSRRSVADTVIDCWPGPTHWMPCGCTVSVVSGVYDDGGSGPTEIRSSPGARGALLNTVTVLSPALSITGIADQAGTSGLSAATGMSTGVPPLTLTDSGPPAGGSAVWSISSR